MNKIEFKKMEKKISEAEKLLAEQRAFLHRIAEEEGATPRAEDNANLSTPSPDTDILDKLIQVYGNVDNRLISVPTEYGSLMLWKPTFKEAKELYQELDDKYYYDEVAFEKGRCGLSDTLLWWGEVKFEGNNIIVAPNLGKDATPGWMALWCEIAENPTRPGILISRFIVPVKLPLEKRPAPVCLSLDSMESALRAMRMRGFVSFARPDLYWKVTRPGAVCRDMTYECGKLFRFSGKLSLHEAGFHYASDFNKILDWYAPFDGSNEIYYVQVAKNAPRIEQDGVGVTNEILFNQLGCTLDDLGVLPF